MKSRKKFSREFKISVLRELENGKNAAQVCREHDIHPTMLSKWKGEYKDNPETAFSGKGIISKPEAKLAESERLVGQLYAENAFFKKSLDKIRHQVCEQYIKKYQKNRTESKYQRVFWNHATQPHSMLGRSILLIAKYQNNFIKHIKVHAYFSNVIQYGG